MQAGQTVVSERVETVRVPVVWRDGQFAGPGLYIVNGETKIAPFKLKQPKKETSTNGPHKRLSTVSNGRAF